MSEDTQPSEQIDSTSGLPNDSFLKLLLGNDKRIYAFILSLVGNRNDADDLMQETTSVMWRKFCEFEPGSDFVAWGIKIARNRIMNFRKKQANSKLQFKSDIVEILDAESDDMIKRLDQRMIALQECLMKLPGKDRTLIRMRYESDVNVKDLAVRVGLSTHQLYRAFVRIHAALLQCIRRTMMLEN